MGRESYFFCYRLLVSMWFPFEEVSSWCLRFLTLPGPSINYVWHLEDLILTALKVHEHTDAAIALA